ncbi:MAG: hypothetical protein HQ596_06450 [Candidatus Saganbacteria bacterium]|nr:hypothetical protein [Candidatus Saganbacteria bacterium]
MGIRFYEIPVSVRRGRRSGAALETVFWRRGQPFAAVRREFGLPTPRIGRDSRKGDQTPSTENRGAQANLPCFPLWRILREAGIFSYTRYDEVSGPAQTPVRLYTTKPLFKGIGAALRKLAGRSDTPSAEEIQTVFGKDQPFPSLACRISLTPKQYEMLVKYIQAKDFVLDSFGTDPETLNQADAVLALSFGEANTVNAEIARQLFYLPDLRIPIYAQWEIADELKGRGITLDRSQRIGIPEGQDYINSKGVRDEFIARMRKAKDGGASKVVLACQAWHAVRCKKLCEDAGLEVVGLIAIDEFSPNDPQPWVQDAFSWVVKECFGWARDEKLI